MAISLRKRIFPDQQVNTELYHNKQIRFEAVAVLRRGTLNQYNAVILTEVGGI